MSRIDVSTKESFFRTSLVPTGQMLQVFLRLQARVLRRDALVALTHDLFEPLNLASVYVIDPNVDDWTRVESALSEFRAVLLRSFDGLGTGRKAVLSLLLTGKGRLPAGAQKALQLGQASMTLPEIKHLRSTVHEAIGYGEALRHKWFSRHLATPTALTHGKRTNRWRTFARHLSWTDALALLQTDGMDLEKVAPEQVFGHRVGRALAPKLWADTFGPAIAAVPVAPEASDLVPRGVTVKSDAAGRLVVQAKFDPKSLLSAAQLKRLLALGAGMPASLKQTLAERNHSGVASLASLQDAVTQAAVWRDAQAASKERVQGDFGAWENELKRAEVSRKLQAHFSDDERKLLAHMLATS